MLRRRDFSFLVSAMASSYCIGAANSCTASSAAGAVIFLHGSGDTGPGFQRWVGRLPFVQNLVASGVSIQFPSAQPRPYRLFGGTTMSVWYDRLAMEPSAPEHTESVQESCAQLEALLDKIVASGTPPGKILIGGFSMGGAIAIQTALRSKHELGGVFAMSSYLCDDARIYKGLTASSTPKPPIWMAHGGADTFVSPEWGKMTAEKLTMSGFDVQWQRYEGMRHELRQDELDDLNGWMTPRVLTRSEARS
jgi:phospholipase/carboxylesterase